MSKDFSHLHVHTEFSMLDGLGTIPNYVARAKRLGMQHLAITDHGTIAGSYEFYSTCKEAGINPILGCEFYFVPDIAEAREKKIKKKEEKDESKSNRYHVVFLAKNDAGFRTLVDLNDQAHSSFYYKPLVDRHMLSSLGDEAKNLTVLSGCAGSIISRKALHAKDEVEAEVEWWTKHFPNFYIELQNHEMGIDRKLNRRLMTLATRMDLPLVVTNDPHYVTKDQADMHDCLLAIQTASDVDDPNRFRFDGHGYHLRSRKEMDRAFRKYDDEIHEAMDNTIQIAKEIDIKIPAWETRTWHVPELPGVDDAYKRMKKIALRRMEELGLDKKPEYVKRVKHELPKLKKANISGALLITRDAIRYANRKDYRVGPGRGSIAGCFVAYLLGIHKIDSVRYDLLFERFLNPERPKMPDIDTDFERANRDKVIEYTIRKFGAENVIRVGAYQTMGKKKAFQSLARAFGMDHVERNKFSALIVDDEEGNSVLPAEIHQRYPELVELLQSLEGLKSGISRHAAGVIILNPGDDIRELIPSMWLADSKKMVCQFNLDTSSALGLFKQDYLVVRALDTISACVRFIKERHDIDIDPDTWTPDEEQHDKKIYKMLAEGRTAGVFQMEGSTNHRGIQQIKPKQFEDIVACTSLYRAGPLDAGADKRFLENREDKRVRVIHKSLEPILRDTWGEMIYQEQMFRILNELAGFSWARVDDAKTAVTKKDAAKMAALKDEAVEGFQKIAGMSLRQAEQVWEMIAAQATYLFNRSHAVAYSLLSYQTARLKYLYPVEYLAALLATVEPKNKTDKAKRERYMAEAAVLGFKMLPPDVNKSRERFSPEGEDSLRFGFFDVSGIGEKAAPKMVKSRPKKGYETLAQVQKAAGNAGIYKALMESGALESFGVKFTKIQQENRLSWQFDDPMLSIRKKYEKKCLLPSGKDGTVRIAGQVVKSEIRKAKNGNRFCTWIVRWAPGIEYKCNIWESGQDLFDTPKGRIVFIEGKWQSEWQSLAVNDSDQVRFIRA